MNQPREPLLLPLTEFIDVTHFLGPCVYALFDERHPLSFMPFYVGKGHNIGRAMDSASRRKAASVQVIMCKDRHAAAELEYDLINMIMPAENRVLSATPTRNGKRIYPNRIRKPPAALTRGKEYERTSRHR